MELKTISVDKIKPDPNQPRKTFNEESLKFLAESILGNELLKPIEVDENNIIIDGERRWRACKIAKLKEIEVRVIKIGKNGGKRLRRQIISDIQNEDVPTGERYESLIRLWKIDKIWLPDLTKKDFCFDLGITPDTLISAFDYCEFAEEEPELAKQVSARVIADTKSLPKEERKELLEEFKEIPKEEKKTDLMRHLVKEKRKELQDKKELEKLREIAKNPRELKIITDRERAFKMRDEIIETQNQFNKLMSNVRWARHKKFFFQKPKQREDFLKFLEGTSQRARKWADELDELRETIEIEIVKE